jgi:pyruvate/2-oxoglutarate dehydrogenase complex dihydrolipoamide acyltransferase (E2) component
VGPEHAGGADRPLAKQEGEAVEKGEPLLEVETEKMTNLVEAPAAGILAASCFRPA